MGVVMSKYANLEDRECLLETLSTEEEKDLFLYGFYSAISYAYYKNLAQEDKDLWCNELLERVIENYGLKLFEEFLQEHNIGVERKE